MQIFEKISKTPTGSIRTFGEWGELPYRVNVVSFPTEGDTVQDQLHKHQNGRETYFVIQGEAVFEVNEKEVRVLAGQALTITPGEVHRLKHVIGFHYLSVVVNSVNDKNDRIALM